MQHSPEYAANLVIPLYNRNKRNDKNPLSIKALHKITFDPDQSLLENQPVLPYRIGMDDNPSLADVKRRRAQINKRRHELAQEDRALTAEDQELVVAERVLERLGGTVPPRPSQPEWALTRPPPENATLEQLLGYLLEGKIDPWATSNQLQEALTLLKKREVPMSSVSPTLTSMKDKGIIVRDGLKVALKTRIATATAAR
jgi:hypothetical protein